MKQTDVSLSARALHRLSSQSQKNISHPELVMLKLMWISYLILKSF